MTTQCSVPQSSVTRNHYKARVHDGVDGMRNYYSNIVDGHSEVAASDSISNLGKSATTTEVK